MAETTYLALLNSAQQQGQAFAENIMRTNESAARLQQQDRQFNQQLAVQQSQFGEKMALDHLQLEESRRVNNMNAARYTFLDELAAKEFESEMSLEPLRAETAKINLEASKIQKERMLQQNRDVQFNSITKPFDVQASGLLAGSRSEDFGNSYLALKSKYQSDVARGLPFDEAGFRSEYDALASQYTDVVPNSEYNPALATLMDAMGATNEANRMRAENPVFSGSIAGLKAGALTGGRQAFNETVTKYGNFLGSDDDIAAFSMNADGYFGLDEAIKSKTRELETLQRSKSYAKTEDQKAAIDTDVTQLQSEISQARQQQSAIYQRAIGVQTATSAPQEDISDEERRARRNLGLAVAQKSDTQEVTPPSPNLSNPNYELNMKRSAIQDFAQQFPEALGGDRPFNFKAIQMAPKDVRRSESHIKEIRNHVLRNINSLPTDDREAAVVQADVFSNASGEGGTTQTLEGLIKSPEFGKIFETLKNKSVKTPPIGYGNESGVYIGDRSLGKQATSFFTDFFDNYNIEIESQEDVINLIRNFDGTPDQKRIFMEKLYASVVTAGAVEAFSLPEPFFRP